MRVSDDLFQLIKALSRGEKRYFKLQASLYGGEKNYLLLFEAIDAQEVYDEEKLRAQFQGEPFVRQFNVAKRYLYDQIMRTLRSYHAAVSVRARIREMVQNVEILYMKDLQEQARKMYNTALAFATEHEDFVGILEVLVWAEKMEPESCSEGERIDRIFGDIIETMEKFRNYLELAAASRKMAQPILNRQEQDRRDLAALDEILKLLPASEEETLSVRAAIHYSYCHAIYHVGRGEYAESLRHTERQIELMETHPAQIELNPLLYLVAISNQVDNLRMLGRVETFWSMIEKLRSKGKELTARSHLRNHRVNGYLFFLVHGSMMKLQLGLQQKEGARELIREVEEGLMLHNSYLRNHQRVRLYYDLSLLYFNLGEFRRALDYNNMIVQGNPSHHAQRPYYHARLVSLVIHYELGNIDLLEYLVVSTHRYFRTRNLLGRFEEEVLHIFRRLPRVKGGHRELAAFLEDARERMIRLRDDPQDADGFEFFPYIQWLDSRIAALRRTAPVLEPGIMHHRELRFGT